MVATLGNQTGAELSCMERTVAGWNGDEFCKAPEQFVDYQLSSSLYRYGCKGEQRGCLCGLQC